MPNDTAPANLGKIESAIVGLFAHRMSLWLWASVAGLVALYFLARHMVGVVGFKVVLMTIAGYLGYWISRLLERGQRPHVLYDRGEQLAGTDPIAADAYFQRADALALRRTLVVAACLVASALGG